MFKDHFSGHAAEYQQARPTYPHSLFKTLADQVDEHRLAWDCGTGNGQAAVSLADYFDHVIATDASAEQIQHATQHPNVTYRVATAEESGLDSHSANLITVAQALHWFDHEPFFNEVQRILKPKGVFAAWYYRLLHIEAHEEKSNALIQTFYQEMTGPYWPPERRHIDTDYQHIPFPLERITLPDEYIELDWTLQQLLNYLNTWSGVKRYEKEKNQNPVDTWLQPRLVELFGSLNSACPIQIPVSFLAGKVS